MVNHGLKIAFRVPPPQCRMTGGWFNGGLRSSLCLFLGETPVGSMTEILICARGALKTLESRKTD